MRLRRHELHRWWRWKAGTFEVVRVPGGVIVDFRVSEVNGPFVSVLRGQERRIFDAGFRWVYFTPLAEKHSVIVALDDGGVPLQVYVDVTQGNHLDADGFPVIDDVFLDVLSWVTVTPEGCWTLGEPQIIDQEELDAALAAGEVTPEQHAAAWVEARRLVRLLEQGRFPALDTLRNYLLAHPL